MTTQPTNALATWAGLTAGEREALRELDTADRRNISSSPVLSLVEKGLAETYAFGMMLNITDFGREVLNCGLKSGL